MKQSQGTEIMRLNSELETLGSRYEALERDNERLRNRAAALEDELSTHDEKGEGNDT